ncbi:DUF2267 domain-containing protein [Halobium salinum]|uniref:DUF2267 domain-containing protein n=1 Tax=Halobium salinum TaxID=1364940 RepID=A0ABD5P8Y3_9EURY|nr:DUF2267 domain-containing protein [Halobium salinum]
MDYDSFIGTVQQHGEYAGSGEAVSATRATLATLGERIDEGEAEDLAAQLPAEVGEHLTGGDHGEQFDFETFLERVADRAEHDAVAEHPEDATNAVVRTLQEALGRETEIADVLSQLPQDEGYGGLFESVA